MTDFDAGDDPFGIEMPETAARLRKGRYYFPEPGAESDKDVAHTRMTNRVKKLADNFALERWNIQQVLTGMALDETLYMKLIGIPDFESEEGKKELDEIAALAKERAGGNFGARRGTAYHAMTENLDRGNNASRRLPARYQPKMLAYQEALKRHRLVVVPEYIERRVRVAHDLVGTLDRILMCELTGKLYVGDLKGLALDTPIPTPSGWTTMGAVQPGDQVFDAFGKPCQVLAKSEIKQIGTYVVKFDDGSEIVCDTEHIWWTNSSYKRNAAPTAKSISEVISTLRDNAGQAHHRVPVAGALDLPEAELPIDPYLLGCWLGNGETNGGSITSMPDLFEVIESDGHSLGKITYDRGGSKAYRQTPLGLRTKLRKAGIFGNKHVPDVYLRASFGQRLRLLQGLLDTDGTWNTARRTAVFYSTSKTLAAAAHELAIGLGQRANLGESQVSGYGKTVTCYRVEFTPVGINPFRLPRKAAQCEASTKNTFNARRRVIVSVEPGPDAPTACIAVDSKTRTYLCGDAMIPTHNTQKKFWSYTEIAPQLAGYANASHAWDDVTQSWEEMPDVQKDIAIVIWMPHTHPSGNDEVEIHDVRIDRAWEVAVPLAGAVKDWQYESQSLASPRPLPVL